MFNAKTKSEQMPLATKTGTSLIGEGTVFTGDITASGDMRIDGTIKGNINSKSKIVIGPEGLVEGDVEGEHADIMGRVSGSVRVTDLLHLRAKSHVEGNISAKQLQVEPEATFNGQCQMMQPAAQVSQTKGKEFNDKKMPALSVSQA